MARCGEVPEVQLSVAVVPPEEVLRAVRAALDAVPRLRDEMDVPAPGALRLPVIGLGNLTRPDAAVLCEALADEVAALDATARVRLAGVRALEEADDPTVALPLAGDVDVLTAVTQALPPIVAARGYFVDRRRFVPRLVVARVTPATTLPVLERLVAALEQVDAPAWDVAAVHVLSRVHREDGVAHEVFRTLPTVRDRAVPLSG